MKKKTEEKRQHILDAASDVFQEYGFERASMSEIRKRVGGSKATLYNYFNSKEELFFETVFRSIEAEFEAAHNALNPDIDDFVACLCNFGEKLLAFLYSKDSIANRRVVIAQSDKTDIGKIVYEKAISRCNMSMGNFLKESMKRNRMKECDIEIAVKHFSALLESEILMPSLLNVKQNIEASEIKEITKRAVDVFVAAYGSKS